MIPVVLTIAGSDSSGGAGIQADLKTFASLRAYGGTVVTAITAQDTSRVHEVFTLPPEWVGAQFDAVFRDIPPAAIKIGMLGGVRNVRLIAEKLETVPGVPVVLDPVLVSTSGASLLEPDAVPLFRAELLPRALLVTPNLMEAGALTDTEVRTVPDMEDAARAMRRLGVKNVLVTGGHLAGEEVVDVFHDGNGFRHLRRKRIPSRPHGTGCVLSAAVAAYLAKGLDLGTAVEEAEAFTRRAIGNAVSPGSSAVCDPGPPASDKR